MQYCCRSSIPGQCKTGGLTAVGRSTTALYGKVEECHRVRARAVALVDENRRVVPETVWIEMQNPVCKIPIAIRCIEPIAIRSAARRQNSRAGGRESRLRVR